MRADDYERKINYDWPKYALNNILEKPFIQIFSVYF